MDSIKKGITEKLSWQEVKKGGESIESDRWEADRKRNKILGCFSHFLNYLNTTNSLSASENGDIAYGQGRDTEATQWENWQASRKGSYSGGIRQGRHTLITEWKLTGCSKNTRLLVSPNTRSTLLSASKNIRRLYCEGQVLRLSLCYKRQHNEYNWRYVPKACIRA